MIKTFKRENSQHESQSLVLTKLEQGVRLADAAKKANVKHFVYTSVGGAERNTGIPHFDSKFAIEEHIRRINLPYSILRPVFFMDNLTAPGALGKIVGAFYKYQMSPDRKIQMISVRDIGQFARQALEVCQPSILNFPCFVISTRFV
jgi:uncharacterized protein YbjT (DUF2867 family)